jgi:hypothetical protein
VIVARWARARAAATVRLERRYCTPARSGHCSACASFGPDVAADYSDRGENRDPGRRQKTVIDKGDAIRERRPLIYFAALRLIVGAVMSSACLMRVMTPVGPDVVR